MASRKSSKRRARPDRGPVRIQTESPQHPGTIKSSMKQTLVALAITIVATIAVRGPLLNIPFERDEGEYAYIAWRLGHDELPYRDWVDQKPPAIFWVYRAGLMLPIDPIRAVHLVALLFAAASTCALFFLALRVMNRFWAFIAAALF